MEEQDDGFILVNHERKRPAETAAERQSKRGRVQPAATKPTVPPPANKPRVQRCTKTLHKQADFRAKSAAGQAKLGKGCVYQLSKMEGHILVGLSSVQLAERLIEEGLDIEEATLRAFPLRKKAEWIAVGNVLFFVTDADLIAALKPYGQVTSIVQQMLELDNSCWADARREAFITLHDGVRLSQIPARLDIKTKGVITPVYVSYGIRCSLCHRQGHKRANCPQKTDLTEDKLPFPERPPVARQKAWNKPLASSSQASPAAAPTPAADIPSSTATAVAGPPPSDSNDQATADPNKSKKLPPSQDKQNLAQSQMADLVKNDKASAAIASVQQLALEREQLLQAFTNNGLMDKLLAKSNTQQRQAIDNLATALMAFTGNTSDTLYKKLRPTSNPWTKKETSATATAPSLCLQRPPWDQASPASSRPASLFTGSRSYGLARALPPAPDHCSYGAWILGDLNISEESAKDLASGSAESLAELLDQADLVDIATFFDAALEHTRVATIGSRVDAPRLDRILLPSGFCDRVTQYQTIDYAYSDHRAVLIQVGDPAPTRLPCIGKLLRLQARRKTIADFLAEVTPLEFDERDQLFHASIRLGDVYIKAFLLLNEVRQGCRLSAALFSIGVGPLLRRLERILGRGNVVAYADDIVLFIRDDAQFELVPLIFEEFRMSSGVAVNFKKSCGLWFGCTITTRNTVASQASHLMGLLERAIARWSPFTRGLSLVVRARAANSLVLGSILHHLHGYLPPETSVGRLQARLPEVPASSRRQQVPAAPDLLAPERWLQATVGDFSDGAPALARSTRAALLDAQHLGAFCQRLLRENASSSYHAEYEAETIVLRGSATPITRLTSQRARLALDSARRQAHSTAELAARWTPTVDVPRSIPWADLRRNCFSGHDADVALRLALHALPHPDHPASRRANCAALPLDLQAWLFAVGIHPEAVKITSVAKATIYKYHLGLERAQISSPKPSGLLRRTPKESVTFVRNTRQQQALNKARSSTATFDQCCYVEWFADFHPVHYKKALEELLGKESIYQLMKKSGHIMVGLASIEKAERLVENGLTINNTFLRAFPYRRKAEKIILGEPAHRMVSCNGYTWTTGNRCSRCHRQGHRRATCPQGTRSGPVLTPPSSQPTPFHSDYIGRGKFWNHPDNPCDTSQSCRVFARGKLPSPFPEHSSRQAFCSGAEHQRVTISTSAFLDRYFTNSGP
ncbi:hypothetical protein LAZ67_22000661 [Cordylochernes scorpioides]|uniref:CCHC-type domain-containing protein n=1 Tax=Cordylochernes scorpioides TaxID=51811 RepID=A0ABY6LSL7_9ARAC|nr:hypothetical protein LAZ67_22000661 [Cordylochernes scorpioides]